MKRNFLPWMHRIIAVVLLLAVMSIAGACAGGETPAPAPAPTPTPKPIELKAVTFMPVHIIGSEPFAQLISRINERANGRVVIDLVGGPEAIPQGEQPVALRRGTVDMIYTAAGVNSGLVPEGQVLPLSRMTPQEERQSGAHDILVELHMRANQFYLGREFPVSDPIKYPSFYIYSNKKMQTLAELSKLTMGPGNQYIPVIKALSGGIVVIPTTELYTALERGTVDTCIYAIASFTAMRFHEVTKYWIDTGFFNDSLVTLMNLDRWNELPADLQKLVTDTQLEIEQEYQVKLADYIAQQKQMMVDAKMEPIELSSADAEQLLDVVYSVAWDDLMQKSPDTIPQLKSLLYK